MEDSQADGHKNRNIVGQKDKIMTDWSQKLSV